jgi:PII-like signaling protein
MVKSGPAKKLTIYVDEADKFHGKPVYEVLLDIFYKRKVSGASVFRGVAGYGSDGVFHTAKMLELSTTLPVKIEVVDSEEMINDVLPDVTSIVGKGLVEVSDTQVIKCCERKK